MVAGFFRSFVAAALSPLLGGGSVAIGSANGTGIVEKIRINESPDWLHRKEPGLVGDRLQCVRRRQARHFATSVCCLC